MLEHSPFSHVKWIFFDIGYTLVNEDEVWRQRFREQADLPCSHRYSPEELFSAFQEATAKYQTQYRPLMLSLGFSGIAPFRPEYEVPYPDAAKVLKTLGERYHLAILANQQEGFHKRLEDHGLASFFELSVVSSEVGLEKPDPAIFRLALKKAGCAPEEAVMVGDRYDNDILPANLVGMRTIRVMQGMAARQMPLTGAYRANAEITSLKRLPKIL